MPNRRGYNYSVLNPRVFTPMNLRLDEPARQVLAVMQDTLQKRLDRKVPLKEIVTGLLLGTLKPEQFVEQ